MLAKRCLETAGDLLAHVEARAAVERGGRKAHAMATPIPHGSDDA